MRKITHDFLVGLFIALYREQYLQTVWNAYNPAKRKEGFTLASGVMAPWYFDMRCVGNSPDLWTRVTYATADMISAYDINKMIGVEMAGLPLVGSVSNELTVNFNHPMKFGYTRPILFGGKKVTKPEDAARILKEAGPVAAYGDKHYVECRFAPGDKLAIVDDVATTFGSKLVARTIVLHGAGDIPVTCNHVFYFLNRGKGNRDYARNFSNEPNQDLYPASLTADYVIEFDDFLPYLEGVMTKNEFATIQEHQKNPKRFHNDLEWRNEVIGMATAGA